ncbi:hypothetical protein [Anditalea andensis]|uniref:Integral membrane protein n=1 Tax=Anditalea andensis TaxID=1048983 RepID=A0A074L5T4_9BACT|nr:hypothetical protein [Anditalea andensis]KEO75178.1 hypothetical protein EL17_05780 [Anditalea andensis]
MSIFKYRYLLLLLFSCSSNEENPMDQRHTHIPFESTYQESDLIFADQFISEGESKGASTLLEASGLVYSRKNPGYLWSHQDKGNDSRLFLLDSKTGKTVASYRIAGIINRDWEDIEIGPGPEAGVNYIYLGDVGDNDQVYQEYTIYRFKEPLFEETHRGKITDLSMDFDKIIFNYPDKSHDVEALMVDPGTKDIYLATKRDFWSMLFVAPYPQPIDQRFTVLHAGNFSFRRALAGNVSQNGEHVLIKNDDRIFYWEREKNENFTEMLSRAPKLAPYNPVEAQGEAICFDPLGGYYTLSEFSNGIIPELYHYKKK